MRKLLKFAKILPYSLEILRKYERKNEGIVDRLRNNMCLYLMILEVMRLKDKGYGNDHEDF